MTTPTLSQAIATIKAGRQAEGRAMLEQILASDPGNVNALLWMTEIADTSSERREYLDRILEIDPNNAMALRGLEVLEPAVDDQVSWITQAKPATMQSDSASTSSPDTEIVYYTDDAVTVTNARAMFRGKTYALANVTSVEMVIKQPENQYVAILLIAIGLVLVLGAVVIIGSLSIGTVAGLLFSGVIAGLFGVWIMRHEKPSYIVRISSSSREADALISEDQQYIQNIVKAVNEAFIKRG